MERDERQRHATLPNVVVLKKVDDTVDCADRSINRRLCDARTAKPLIRNPFTIVGMV